MATIKRPWVERDNLASLRAAIVAIALTESRKPLAEVCGADNWSNSFPG